MKLPPNLRTVEAFDVNGRQGWKLGQELYFGPFQLINVQRSLTKGGDLRILSYDQSRRKQVFSFNLFDGEGGEWEGNCETYLRRRRLDTEVEVDFQNRTQLGGQFRDIDTGERWELKLVEDWESPLKGYLRGAGRELQVRGTRSLQGSPLPLDEASGYIIEEAGRPIAAVETLNDGKVWLSGDLDGALRGPIVSCLSSLLLLESLRVTLDE